MDVKFITDPNGNNIQDEVLRGSLNVALTRMEEMIIAYKIAVGKCEGERQIGRASCRERV